MEVDKDIVCSVPPHWTDLVAPDLEMVLSDGRAFFRVGDLLGLAQMVAMLGARSGRGAADDA